MNDLERLACAIALEVPERPKFKEQPSCYVPWDLVNKIRAEMEKRNIDWRRLRKDVESAKARHRAELVRGIQEVKEALARREREKAPQ